MEDFEGFMDLFSLVAIRFEFLSDPCLFQTFFLDNLGMSSSKNNVIHILESFAHYTSDCLVCPLSSSSSILAGLFWNNLSP